ncbi:hypothetical protein ACIF6L_31890 [Kitasatospora sp. NPDC086009]|uniref:hypothetical protein n=1 Tax=unclassified Kitasatospora TaxID=2633591 RepID=UPI0037C574C5
MDLPLDFEAYALLHRESYLHYAEEMLGNQGAARLIVRQVLVRIALDWKQILRAPNVEDITWGMLTTAVVYEVRRLHGEEQLAVRADTARSLLAQMRESLTEGDAEDTDVGLIPALWLLTPPGSSTSSS